MREREDLTGCRILIVEDRYLIATELAEEVARLGAEVIGPARDVAAALALVADQPPSLALLDVNLDGELVFPLAENLAARHARFIFLTGYDDDVLPAAWRDAPRLQKPIDPKALRREFFRLADGWAQDSHM